LFACNINNYPPDVENLCQSPFVDNAFSTLDGKTAYLLRRGLYWILYDLATDEKLKPTRTKLNVGGIAAKKWKNYNPTNGAIFLIRSGTQIKPVLFQKLI
jgi:hypothetical protein